MLLSGHGEVSTQDIAALTRDRQAGRNRATLGRPQFQRSGASAKRAGHVSSSSK
jgi:hypothetical protein